MTVLDAEMPFINVLISISPLIPDNPLPTKALRRIAVDNYGRDSGQSQHYGCPEESRGEMEGVTVDGRGKYRERQLIDVLPDEAGKVRESEISSGPGTIEALNAKPAGYSM